MYMAVALLVWVAWIINPNSLNYMVPPVLPGGFFLYLVSQIPTCEANFISAKFYILWNRNGAGLYTACPYAKRHST